MSEVGDRIREKRKELKKTQLEVSKFVGVTSVAVSQWENNDSIPKGKYLFALADLFNCTAGWLLTGDENFNMTDSDEAEAERSKALKSSYKINMDDLKSMPDRVKAARKYLGITQADLAEMVGMKQPSIASLEAGNSKYTKFIGEIANALDCDTSWLLYGRGRSCFETPATIPLNTLANRMKAARKKRGLTQEELSNVSGVNRSSIASVEAGKVQTISFIDDIASALDCDKEWLLYGHGKSCFDDGNIEPSNLFTKLKETLSGKVSDDVLTAVNDLVIKMNGHNESNITAKSAVRGVRPLISWVQAGLWTETCNSFTKEDAEAWRTVSMPCSEQSFYLTVVGDSMMNPTGSPSIPEGMKILVDPNVRCKHGDLVVAKKDAGASATFKQLHIEDDVTYLKPLNPNYRLMPVGEGYEIIGKVIKAEIDF